MDENYILMTRSLSTLQDYAFVIKHHKVKHITIYSHMMVVEIRMPRRYKWFNLIKKHRLKKLESYIQDNKPCGVKVFFNWRGNN